MYEETERKAPLSILVDGGGSTVMMGGRPSDPAGADSAGQIAQNGVTQDTETPFDSGNAGQAADNTRDGSRQTQTDTDPPPDSGQMVATDNTATTSPALTNPSAFHLGEMLAMLFNAGAAGSAYNNLRDRPNGLLWMTRALEPKPGEGSFVALQAAFQGGGTQ
jgi:hypothetical protein